MIDGAKALCKAVRDVLGTKTPIQRCIRHKERNVQDHYPSVTGRASAACGEVGTHQAREELAVLASELERLPPRCGGLEETLTIKARGTLKRTLQSTNPCESMIECVRRSSRNVKRWQSGEKVRWTAAGLEADAVPTRDRLPDQAASPSRVS